MKRFLFILVLLGAAAWGWHSYNGGWMPAGGDAVSNAQQTGGRGVGTIQALNTGTVRTQVDGRLLEIAFRDGQDVRKGDVLAKVDPATYQAQYDQAVAKKAQDEAQLANARADLERYAKLAQTDYGSRQQADTQRATVAQLEAQIRSDQGAIDNAKAYLDYTTIRAPIDGRLGIRQVDQGNIVRASDTNGLVVITQLKPIAMVFNLPQQQLRAVSAAVARGSVEVDALDSDGTTIIDKGVVEVIDNVVDQTTGTIKVKARFPNERLQLWPGQFVNVRVFVDVLKHVVVAPTAIGPTWALTGEDVDTPNLARILGEVRARRPLDPARLLLTGLSDGGTFCYVSGLAEASPFTHLAPVAAAFHPMLMAFADPDRLRGLPSQLVHGARDWMFPVELARQARATLAAAGADVAYREIDDLSHAYPREINAELLAWLKG